MGGQKEVASQEFSLEGDEVNSIIGPDYHRQLMDDIELLDGACDELDMERVSRGNLSPVFFGSALTNFGVETFLEHFLKMTTSPLREIRQPAWWIRSLRISARLSSRFRQI
mgnify:FL=1